MTKKSLPASYGSDMAANILRELGIEYAAFNPGSSYRGLHDSIVNYLGNQDPELILCCHESIAVSMAHGYAKVTGKPMAAMMHDTVGLLNAPNAIYAAWQDQTPVLLVGANGPMAIEKRRAGIDWVHTSLVPGNVIRDYIKWDTQPFSLASIPDALIRAYRVAMTEPRGPVYVCLDTGLQEESLTSTFPQTSPQRYRPPSSMQAEPAAITQAAKLLVAAENPIVIADYLGRNPEAIEYLIELAELLAIPVIDAGSRFNFPNTHPLDLTGAERELLKEADVVLALDVPNLARYLTTGDRISRESRNTIASTTQIIHITLHDLALRSWSENYGKLVAVDVPIAADTALALPVLITTCRQLISSQRHQEIQNKFKKFEAHHQALRQQWQESCRESWQEDRISLPRLAAELGQVIKGEDWVLTNGTLVGWLRRLWDWEKPYQYFGGAHGLGCGAGYSLGVALAQRRYERLCISIQSDGDFLYTPQALWTAAHHQIPMLVVMYNNRSYYNSESHQEIVAQHRGRPVENSFIGTRIENPAVNYAELAHSFGLYGEGPIEHPDDLRPALERALTIVRDKKQLALVDVVTQNR
jgi:thiamine pyrophosphate-dependent acetolactate synthase large subunit-like protein